jgi:hypothetical protein
MGNWTSAASFANNGVLTLQTNGNITQAASTTISLSAGNTALLLQAAGNVSLNQATNDFNTLAAQVTGNFTIYDANNLTIGTIGSVHGIDPATVTIVIPGTLTIDSGSPITASGGSGYTIVLAANNIINNDGANALVPGTGNYFQIWTGNPASDTYDGITPNFIQYNATYGVTTPDQATGNGFFYSIHSHLLLRLDSQVMQVKYMMILPMQH